MLCNPVELQLNTVNFKRMELCNEEDNKKAVDIYWVKVSWKWWATLLDIKLVVKTRKKMPKM